MEYVEVDGLRVALDRAGSGPALLLLHGAACDSRVWRAEIEAFSFDYTVIAWDAPGCGASDDPPESFRLGDYARCLSEFIDVLGLHKPHLLGHSWGSGLALALSLQRPMMPSSLVLAGGYAGWAGSLPAREVAQRLAFALGMADLAEDEFDPSSMPGLFSERMPAHRARELAEIMRDVHPAGVRTMARAFAGADLRDGLATIDIPTLVLCGGADERSPRIVSEALHAAIAGSTFVVLPELGHEMFLEASDTCHDAVRSFLRSLGS